MYTPPQERFVSLYMNTSPFLPIHSIVATHYRPLFMLLSCSLFLFQFSFRMLPLELF
uniref:Uncharacterized protein n=1 Tax=Rhizophora mucronata TaxID=61149 RepID=A0A2P2QJB9_RHIMU